jgi:uncharacterized repeat protein (TIGR02543 family)
MIFFILPLLGRKAAACICGILSGPKIPARIAGGVWIPVMGILAFLILSCPTGLENDSGTFYTVYTITFKPNNGDPTFYRQVVANNRAAAPDPKPSKEGYVFTGWYDSQDLANLYYFNVPVTADITLYAKWEPEPELETELTTKSFWAQRMDNNQYYQIQADLLAEGSYCKIWVEQDPKGSVSPALAQNMADVYDNNIYSKMIEAFNIGRIQVVLSNDSSRLLNNIMELADWLTDGDGKLSILLLDIQDTYDPSGNRSYVGGYFWTGNFYPQNSADLRRYSNETDMIYVDTYPGRPGEEGSNKTLAHEMQHLMNFVTSVVVRSSEPNKIDFMDLWIDEGLSSAAEYIYLGTHSNDRYEWFQEDPKGTIAKGNNFFVWGNYEDESVLDDYATVYLFFQWLRLQSGGGTEIYKSIISSKDYDYHAVTKAMKPSLGSLMTGDSDWSGLLKTWMAANYINAPDGLYGYRGEPKLDAVTARIAPAGTTSLQLLPGEGVYSITNDWGKTSSYASDRSPNIKYAGINPADTDFVSDDKTSPGGALLTYNVNIDTKSAAETGKLTGIAAGRGNRSAGAVSQARSAGNTAWEGPVSIDARDMLVRNGQSGEGFNRVFFPGAKVFTGEVHVE